MESQFAVTEDLARKVLAVVDAGLVNGMGRPEPGHMCIEAAVCYAMGLPHSDEPTCVGKAVRAFKIRLNDSPWSSPQARAKGMRKLAIAQLGSDAIDQKEFKRIVAEQTIRQIVPIALRAAAKRVPKRAEQLEAAAVRCEKDGDVKAARAAYADADAYAAAAADADAAADAARDSVLSRSAEIGLAALIELKSPGCAFLGLADAAS